MLPAALAATSLQHDCTGRPAPPAPADGRRNYLERALRAALGCAGACPGSRARLASCLSAQSSSGGVGAPPCGTSCGPRAAALEAAAEHRASDSALGGHMSDAPVPIRVLKNWKKVWGYTYIVPTLDLQVQVGVGQRKPARVHVLEKQGLVQ